MKETAHYCDECINELTPFTVKSGKEKEFWTARNFPPILPATHDRGPHTIHGICDRCGQAAMVSFYQIRTNQIYQ